MVQKNLLVFVTLLGNAVREGERRWGIVLRGLAGVASSRTRRTSRFSLKISLNL